MKHTIKPEPRREYQREPKQNESKRNQRIERKLHPRNGGQSNG